MKIKHQLTIFSITTKLLIVLILWFSLPLLVEKVVYRHIDNSLLEKKQKFIAHLDKEEINGFLIRKDSSEIYASFSNLHNAFLQLYQIQKDKKEKKFFFKNESRIIEEEENDYRILYFDFTYEQCDYRLEIGNDLSEIEDLIYVIKIFILLVLIASVLLTLLTETVFIEYLLKPFNKIITTKIKYSNEPDSFDFTEIQTHSSDFKELDEGLNLMMHRIQETFNNEKQFIANVSHELLTPIALLKNRFENLIQNKSLDDEAIDKVVSSLKTLDVLKKIINNLLLISRIENNQYHAKETIHCRDLINELVEELDDYLQEKNISVTNTIRESFEMVGNSTLLHILFFNLLVNAIKYTNQNGKISIYDTQTDDDYTITIADNGNGMSEEQLSQIFNRFTRMNFNQEGLGLGLSIVKSIAKFHHIEVKVLSVVNQGSQFVLVFKKIK